jgi:hypothetical protein
LERVPGDIDAWESTARAADNPSTSEPEDGSSRLLALPPDRPSAGADELKATVGDESVISELKLAAANIAGASTAVAASPVLGL